MTSTRHKVLLIALFVILIALVGFDITIFIQARSIMPAQPISVLETGTSSPSSAALKSTSSASTPTPVSTPAKTAWNNSPYAAELTIGTTTINLQVSDTPATQQLGLSYRPSLPTNAGMLFVFSSPSFYHFWMISMNFPLDMIWLDQNYKVVGIKQDATPASYPQTFTSNAPASYVIEVNNGFVSQYGIKEGQTLTITKF